MRQKGKEKASSERRKAETNVNLPSSLPPMAKKSAVPSNVQANAMHQSTAAIPPKKPAVVSPEIATSGPAATTATARLQQRRMNATRPQPSSSSAAHSEKCQKSSTSAGTGGTWAAKLVQEKQQKSKDLDVAKSKSHVPKAGKTSSLAAVTHPLRSTSGSSDRTKDARNRASSSKMRAPDHPRRPAAPTAVISKPSRARSPTIGVPSSTEQTTVYADQRFARGRLDSKQFSYIWHRCDGETQDTLSRLLRWARLENLAGQETTLVEFFAERDEAREWLNGGVIPKVCPLRPENGKEKGKGKERVQVVDLVGDGSEDEDGDSDWSEIVLPRQREESEWVGSSSGSSDGSEYDEYDSSETEDSDSSDEE